MASLVRARLCRDRLLRRLCLAHRRTSHPPATHLPPMQTKKPPSQAHPLSPPHSATHLPPILLGAALTTVFFLTMIGFTRRRATVVETALVFLYVTYCAWISGKEELLQ